MFKKVILQLQKHMLLKFPEYNAKFFINRRNMLIHVGFDKAIFSYKGFRTFLAEVDNYLKDNIQSRQFNVYSIPQLINCAKWKFDYVIAKKVTCCD